MRIERWRTWTEHYFFYLSTYLPASWPNCHEFRQFESQLPQDRTTPIKMYISTVIKEASDFKINESMHRLDKIDRFNTLWCLLWWRPFQRKWLWNCLCLVRVLRYTLLPFIFLWRWFPPQRLIGINVCRRSKIRFHVIHPEKNLYNICLVWKSSSISWMIRQKTITLSVKGN